jgi:hypothetical protein
MRFLSVDWGKNFHRGDAENAEKGFFHHERHEKHERKKLKAFISYGA